VDAVAEEAAFARSSVDRERVDAIVAERLNHSGGVGDVSGCGRVATDAPRFASALEPESREERSRKSSPGYEGRGGWEPFA